MTFLRDLSSICPSSVETLKRVNWKKLNARREVTSALGFPDYFPERHKRKMFELANLRPSDAFYDLGCGDASVLLFAVKQFHVRKAVGFENERRRRAKALQRVEQEGFSDRITIKGDMRGADLSQADVILKMHFEDEEDYGELMDAGIRSGTRLIKHDLPLLGFDFDDVDYPFYLIRFPLRKMRTAQLWASKVMGRNVTSLQDLWHELLYYGYEKGYDKPEVKNLDRILRLRTSGTCRPEGGPWHNRYDKRAGFVRTNPRQMPSSPKRLRIQV